MTEQFEQFQACEVKPRPGDSSGITVIRRPVRGYAEKFIG